MTHSEIIESHHVLPVGLGPLFLIGHLALFNFDVIFLGQIAQRLRERELLKLHDEIDSAATLSATEALAHPFCLGDVEGWRPVVVEGTQTYIVGSAPFKAYEVTHHLHYVGGIKDSLDCSVVNLLHREYKITNKYRYYKYFFLSLRAETKRGRSYGSPTTTLLYNGNNQHYISRPEREAI